MPESNINVPVDAPAMKTIADAANLSLQAQTSVNLYRIVPVKVSNITGLACAIAVEAMKYIAAPSDELAKIAYMADNKIPVPDAAGVWTVSCIKQKMSHCGG